MRNDFASLDAQTVEGRLAHVSFEETTFDVPVRTACVIEEDDLGDEDCRKLVFRVIVAGAVQFTGRTRGEAIGFAKTNHLAI